MFFSKKSKKPKLRYFAYKSEIAKYRNVLKSLPEQKTEGRIILVYFFDQTKDEVLKLCAALGINLNTDPSAKADYSLFSAHELLQVKIQPIDDVLSIEVHPLASINDLVQNAVIEGHKEISYFVGMDEPVMKIFGSDRIISVMERLGLKEDEHLEHSMISKSMENALEKIEKKVASPKDIRTSQEEWVKKNLDN